MGLRDRLARGTQTGAIPIANNGATTTTAAPLPSTAVSAEIFQELKGEMHQRLIDKLDPPTRIEGHGLTLVG